MSKLLPFMHGSRTARNKLNEMVALHNCLQNIKGDGLIRVSKTPGGLTFSLDVAQARARIVKSGMGGGTIYTEFQLFEVQDISSTEGVYLCHKQSTSGIFPPPEIEVMNAMEYQIPVEYSPALIKGDRLAAWQSPQIIIVEEEEVVQMRWMGYPLIPPIRHAIVKQLGSTTIICNLIDNTGQEIISGLGAGITVNANITHDNEGNPGNLNVSSPYFNVDEYLLAINIFGQWWLVQTCQTAKICRCAM